MEIFQIWNLNENFKLNNNLFTISNDGLIICNINENNIEFLSKDFNKILKLKLGNKELITSIDTIFYDPWIICISTNFGQLIFFNIEKQLFNLILINNNNSIIKIRSCFYEDSSFIQSYPILLILYSPDLAFINLENIKLKIENKINDIPIQRWHIEYPFIDGILINSNLPTQILPNLHHFPAILTIGNNPFFCVSSIQKSASPKATEIVKQAASRFFRWVSGSETQEELPLINKSIFEWNLKDEGRISKSLDIDYSGRWISIIDNNSRILIIDSIFGYIIKVIKGHRDAQISWINNLNNESILMIYSPFRKMILCLLIPNCEIIDAIKVNNNGKLLSLKGNRYLSMFIDSNLKILLLKINNKKIINNNNNNQIEFNSHFNFPNYLLNQSKDFINTLNNLNLFNDIFDLLKNINNPIEIPTFLRILFKKSLLNNEIYLIFQYIKEKFNNCFELKNSKIFWENNKTSDTELNELFILKTFIELFNYYEIINNFNNKIIDINLNQNPIFKLLENNQINNLINKPILNLTLNEFFLNPILNYKFLFSIFIFNLNINDFFQIFQIIKINKDNFINYFIKWYLEISNIELILIYNFLIELFKIKNIKNLFEKNLIYFNNESINFKILLYLLNE